MIPLDVEKGDKKVTVNASLPGLSPEDIEVTTQNGVLTIKAESQTENEASEGNYAIRERRNGALHRSLRLSSAVDADNAVKGARRAAIIAGGTAAGGTTGATTGSAIATATAASSGSDVTTRHTATIATVG